MNRFRFLLSSLLFLLMPLASTSVGLTAKSPDVNPGEPAPPLELEKLLQAPAGMKANWPSLKGNVVVLEFWATWCAPCIAAMPHLNELTEQFKDKAVKFISITDEDEATVAPFLSRRTIKAGSAWIWTARCLRPIKPSGFRAPWWWIGRARSSRLAGQPP